MFADYDFLKPSRTTKGHGNAYEQCIRWFMGIPSDTIDRVVVRKPLFCSRPPFQVETDWMRFIPWVSLK